MNTITSPEFASAFVTVLIAASLLDLAEFLREIRGRLPL